MDRGKRWEGRRRGNLTESRDEVAVGEGCGGGGGTVGVPVYRGGDGGAVGDTGEGGRADPMEAGALGLGRVDRRRRRREALGGGRTGELLDHVSEVALVDVVHRRLQIVRGRVKARGGRRRRRQRVIERRSSEGLGDAVGDFVEVPEILVSVVVVVVVVGIG